MLNYFYGLLLIFIGLLPSFELKNNADQNLKEYFYKEKVTPNINIDVPEEANNFIPKEISAQAGLFVDAESGKILAQKNKDQRLPMASTTKMMTAILTVKHLDLNKTINVGSFVTHPLDTTMGLSVGDRLTTKELLHGLLIQSGSDAAQVLAKEVAGSEEAFVAMMNEEASYLKLSDTQFTNPVGYDDVNHYSTASDLAKLGKVFLLNNTLAEISSKRSYTATSIDGKKYYLLNTNKLLNNTTYKGIKTGTTFDAGECLVSLYEQEDQKIIGVLLNSPSRFTETSEIIEWTKHNFLW